MKAKHGGELRSFSEKFAIPEKDILDFSSNVNPWGPPESVKAIYPSLVEELKYYPDSEALEFRREVARHFPLWPENVIAGNGASELLDLIFRFLHPKRALLVEPTFSEYRRLLNLQGTEIRSVSLKEGNGFHFPTAEFLSTLQGVEVAVMAQPNNPTGSVLSKEELLHLLQEAKRRNVFMVLDESFIDWIPDRSLAREVRDDSFFFVVRSLTKFYALPGIRMGYGLGSRKLIERLLHTQVPWSCNRVAQKLGIAALRDEMFAAESRAWLGPERDWLESRLREIPSFKVYSSAANFLLVRYGSRPGGPSLVEEVGERGIYLRDLTEFPALGTFYFRTAVRKREENMKLIEALTANPVAPISVDS